MQAPLNPFDQFVDEIRLTFHALGSFASRVGDLDTPGRAVLEFLIRNGPTTVPEIARRRGVTRQHIQTIVNDLAERDLVTSEPNPAHQRSHLITLTRSGSERISRIISNERQLLAPFIDGIDPAQLAASTDLIGALRQHLDTAGSTTAP